MAARFRRKRITSLFEAGEAGGSWVWSLLRVCASLNAHVFILITCCTQTQTHTQTHTSVARPAAMSRVCSPLLALFRLAFSAVPHRRALISSIFFMLKRQVWHCHLAVTPCSWSWRNGGIRGVSSFEKLSHICSRLPWLSYDTVCLPAWAPLPSASPSPPPGSHYIWFVRIFCSSFIS